MWGLKPPGPEQQRWVEEPSQHWVVGGLRLHPPREGALPLLEYQPVAPDPTAGACFHLRSCRGVYYEGLSLLWKGSGQRASQGLDCVVWWGGIVSPTSSTQTAPSPHLLSCLPCPILLGSVSWEWCRIGTFQPVLMGLMVQGSHHFKLACWVRRLSGAGNFSPTLLRPATQRDWSVTQS